MPTRFRLSLALVVLAALPLAACGSDDADAGTSAAADAGDGRYHPPGNGKAMTEQAACDALSSARQAKMKALQQAGQSCSATVRPCPTFLRAQFPGNDCAQYDEGTVTGCAAYYDDTSDCDGLAKAVANCAVAPLAGTHSDGCQ
jgi:hypothetical protein